MTGLTESLANFVAQPGFREIPPEAARIVQSGFIDSIATMLAARNEPVVEILRRFVADRRSQATEARVLLGVESAGSADAALINGTAAHALDYDDVALGGHPSTVLVPAVLAEGETLDVQRRRRHARLPGGYEVWAELLRARARFLPQQGLAPDRRSGHRRRRSRRVRQPARRRYRSTPNAIAIAR